jgi:hypothetical protein
MATIWLGHLCLVGALPGLLPQRIMGDLSREDIAMAFWDVELAPFCYIDFIKH